NVGAVAMTPLILFLINQYGWRGAWFALGFIPWIVVVPPALIWLRRQPEDMGLLPDGDTDEPSAPANPGGSQQPSARAPVVDEVSWTAREAFRTPALWLILASNIFTGMAISGGIVHRIPYMTDLGFSDTVAGTTFVIYGVSAFFAKILWGLLADRYPIRWLAIAVLLGSAFGLSFIIEAGSLWDLYLGYGVVYGLTGGTLVVVGPLIWANYFGRRYQGAIQGLTRPFGLFSSLGGPMFAALVYDATKSYQVAFSAFVGCFVIAAFFIWVARPPVHPSVMAATPTSHQ
ncbi:MAG: MFS transporter, partial [Dehalococcoidia bacterium]